MVRTGYDSVMELAREKPQWLRVAKAACEEAAQANEFAGAWVLQRMGGWAPSLRTLATYGIVQKVGSSRGGRRAYYTMPDRSGVERAVHELECKGRV